MSPRLRTAISAGLGLAVGLSFMPAIKTVLPRSGGAVAAAPIQQQDVDADPYAQRVEILRVITAWDDYIDREAAKMRAWLQQQNRDPQEVYDRWINLASAFGLASITDRSRFSDIPEPMYGDNRLFPFIWSDWPDESKAMMVAAAAVCRTHCERAARMIADRDICNFKPFDEIGCALHDHGYRASEAVFASVERQTVEHIERTKLPEELEERVMYLLLKSQAARER